MTLALFVMVYYAVEKRRRAPNGGFEKFWYSHHLFIVFFAGWQLHGMFCMIKPDRPPFCSFNSIGVFWKYWLVGGVIFIWERVLREVRSRHKTFVSKVIQHPSNVCEVQIKKEKTVTRAGQYIFLNVRISPSSLRLIKSLIEISYSAQRSLTFNGIPSL
jgi:NADPH oxidase 2